MDNNFSPLIDGWCDQIKISRRVLWSNAATYFERLVRTLEAGGVPHQTLADGRQLIELNKCPSGHLNPMANPVRYVERGETCEPLRQRRLCCIRYRLPGLPLCGNCPHIDRPPKGALLQKHANSRKLTPPRYERLYGGGGAEWTWKPHKCLSGFARSSADPESLPSTAAHCVAQPNGHKNQPPY